MCINGKVETDADLLKICDTQIDTNALKYRSVSAFIPCNGNKFRESY